jgi:sodium-dependent dicarboxylate transporter 2/3/5
MKRSGTEAAVGIPPHVWHTLLIIGTVIVAVAAYWIGRTLVHEMAARTLSIFILAAVFWATEALPLFATSFVLIGLEILFLASHGGLADMFTQLLIWGGFTMQHSPHVQPMSARMFLQPFSQDIIILFMGGFLLSGAVTKHGLDQAIASRVLRPFTRSPLLLLYGVLGITAFFSMWMSNTATAAMMIAISAPLTRMLPDDDRFIYAILLAVPFGANIGGIGTPIGTPPNAIAFGALNTAGYHITFLKWILVVVPLEILILATVGLLLYLFFKPGADLKLGELEVAGTLSFRGKATLIILGVTVLLWLTSGQHGMQSAPVALLAAAALTALRVLDQHDVDSIEWDILILMWGGLSLGVALEQSGLMGYISQADLADLPGGTWTVAVVITLVAVGLSTFMSNTATAAILVPMTLVVSLPGKEQFAMLAALACSFAMAIPVSTPPNAIAYATGKIPLRIMLRTGGLISIIAMAMLLLGYRLMLPLIF